MLNNTWRDRKQIRDAMTLKACFPYRDFTPVLVMYWTKETLLQYLVPCDLEMLKKLYPLNGVDENGTSWELLKDTFQFLKDKIGPGADWTELYFIDTCDEDGRPLPPVSTPPGTALVITGYIPPEHEGKNSTLDFVELVEITGGLIKSEDGLGLAGAEDCNHLAESYVLACKHLGRDPIINEEVFSKKVNKAYEYSTLVDCVKSGRHLSSCDKDGGCDLCGFSEAGDS